MTLCQIDSLLVQVDNDTLLIDSLQYKLTITLCWTNSLQVYTISRQWHFVGSTLTTVCLSWRWHFVENDFCKIQEWDSWVSCLKPDYIVLLESKSLHILPLWCVWGDIRSCQTIPCSCNFVLLIIEWATFLKSSWLFIDSSVDPSYNLLKWQNELQNVQENHLANLNDNLGLLTLSLLSE